MSGLFQIGSETEATKQYSLLLTTDYEPPEPPVDPPVDPPEGFGIHSLSASHAGVGDTITITGEEFGETQGSSFVVFGERINCQGWAPCARKATVASWSDEEIVVTVPSMSPGKAGEPGTYHPVYVVRDVVGTWAPDTSSVEAGGELTQWNMSNSANFYIDPTYVITEGTSQSVIDTVLRSAYSSGTWDANTATYETDSDIGIWPNTGIHGVLFDGVTLTATNGTINGQSGGALTLGMGRVHSRMTFLNCTLTGLQGTGSGGRNGVVGIKVWSQGSAHATDFSFVGCAIGTPATGGFNDMNIEVVNEGDAEVGVGPSERFALIDCSIEPAGGQSISFGSGGDIYALVSGCTLKGAGNDPNTGWHSLFECNAVHYVEWRDSEVWKWESEVFNVNGNGHGGVSVYDLNPHLLFENLDIDFTHAYQSNPSGSGASMFAFGYRSNVRIKDCVLNTGTAQSCLSALGNGTTEWSPTWANCRNNDFTGTTVTGYISFDTGPRIPATARGYWEHAQNIHESNILPAIAT